MSSIIPDASLAASALEDWMAKEISEASKRAFETGKFLFGVSSGSVGLFVTISKFTEHRWAILEAAALLLFIGAVATALLMTMPTNYKLSSTFDLTKAQSEVVSRTWNLAIVWSVMWFIGLILASFGFFGAR